jgi:hypothetical protein
VSRHTTLIVGAVLGACSLGAAGCEATITPPVVAFQADVVAPVAVVPPDIYAYPRVYFGGAWAYLVDGFWYQPTPRGWVVFRREPVELARERTRIYAAPRPIAPRTPAYGFPPPAPRRSPYEQGRERTPNPR